LGDSSTVELRTLTPSILVRIQVPQPDRQSLFISLGYLAQPRLTVRDRGPMHTHCRHITTNRGVYHFRRRVPQPSSGYVVVSLGTRNFREAQWLSERLRVVFEAALAEQTCMHPKINAFLKSRLRESLSATRSALLMRPFQPQHVWNDEFGTPSPGPDDEMVERLTRMAGNFEREIKSRDVRPAMPAAEAFAAQFGLPDDPASLNELSLGLVRLALQVNVQHREWLRDGITEPINGEDGHGQLAPTPAREAVKAAAVTPTGPMLSEEASEFLKFRKSSWTAQTLAQNTASIRMLIEICGDGPAGDYDRKRLATVHDTLRGLPALYSKTAKWKVMSLKEIVEVTKADVVPRLAMKTIKRHFTAIAGLFEHLKQRGVFVGGNPAHGFTFPKPKRRARDERQEWKGDNLKRLFASPVWTGCQSLGRRSTAGTLIVKDAKYWLPLLALYHGNRLEEFAQLCVGDIQAEGGIEFFDINDDGDKQLKNPQSRRKVPIHPEMVRLGFLTFASTRGPHQSARLFPELTPGGSDGKLGHGFSKWFTRYRMQVEVYEDKLDYHSLRASFTTKLSAANVGIAIVDQLIGHKSEGVTNSVYVKELPLRTLFDAVSLIAYEEVQLELAA
jgi:integrase